MKKKDELDNDNKEKLKDAALRLRMSEEEVLNRVPEGIWIAYIFNPKALGGHLKRMQSDMTSSEVLKKQLTDDSGGNLLLKFLPRIIDLVNKTQENSSQQQEETSSAVSCEVSKDDSKKSDEVSNSLTEVISIKPLETSSAASCQESTLGGWSNDNKKLLKLWLHYQNSLKMKF